MKATQRDFAGAAARAAKQARYFFFCGPDEAGAAAAAARIVELLPDAGERVELSGAEIKRDPARLGDEARSNSLFGGSRHIWVRANGEEALDPLRILIEQAEADGAETCPVLVVATGASDKSRTAKLLEKRADALVAMFYPPDLSSVTGSVREMADAAGLRLDGDIAERIARAAGLDVRLARSEIDKLALYLDASPQAPKKADADALAEIGAAMEEDGLMPLVNAVLSGKVQRLPAEIHRMREVRLNAVGVALALERRVSQLAGLAARLGPAGDIGAFMEGEQKARRIFWKDRRDLTEQLQRWRGKRLERLGERVMALHRAMLSDSQAGQLHLEHELAEIARAAAPRR